MDTLDSRSLHYIDCFFQKFSKPGKAYYRLTTIADICFPDEMEDAYRIDIKKRQGGDQESQQHHVLVRREGAQFMAEPQTLEIKPGDVVVWTTTDPKGFGFAIQGEGPDGKFDSTAITHNAVYTHAFGTPGDYEWMDANGGRVSGKVYVRSLDVNDVEQCKKWTAALSDGTVIVIRDDSADPAEVEILAGQTVFWAIERAAGISITDSRLVHKKEEYPDR